MNKFEFVKRYVGTIGHFDPRLSIISAHVSFALGKLNNEEDWGFINNGFTGV